MPLTQMMMASELPPLPDRTANQILTVETVFSKRQDTVQILHGYHFKTEKIHIAPDIPLEKLSNAISAYASGLPG